MIRNDRRWLNCRIDFVPLRRTTASYRTASAVVYIRFGPFSMVELVRFSRTNQFTHVPVLPSLFSLSLTFATSFSRHNPTTRGCRAFPHFPPPCVFPVRLLTIWLCISELWSVRIVLGWLRCVGWRRPSFGWSVIEPFNGRVVLLRCSCSLVRC